MIYHILLKNKKEIKKEMWFIILILIVIVFGLCIHDITGDWVDVVDGNRYTIYPVSIIDGDYITYSQSNSDKKNTYAIKYDFISGLINTTNGKSAYHQFTERKIQWPRQTWYKVMDSKGIINFMHDFMTYPNLFGLWHGTTYKNEPIFLQFKMKNFYDPLQSHQCIYDVSVRIWNNKKEKI